MSGRVKQRNAANASDLATLSINERILKDIHSIYVEPDKGTIDSLKEKSYKNGFGYQVIVIEPAKSFKSRPISLLKNWAIKKKVTGFS